MDNPEGQGALSLSLFAFVANCIDEFLEQGDRIFLWLSAVCL